MQLSLRALRPNPFRDFTVDPIDPDNVAELTKSIKEDGFWGGVVARKRGGEYQIACGQHRVAAALKAGINKADVFVLNGGTDDDAAMVRIYARENATQRGNTATAATGSVAAALRVIVKAVLMGDLGKILPTSQRSLETMLGHLEAGHFDGDDLILRLLGDAPGISIGSVKQQLASLKASGDYARIISEIRKEIKEETEDEQILASARAADEAASKKERTFDFANVAKHLKNDNQLRVFREAVTGQGVAPYLDVSKQGQLARAIVAEAKEQGRELTGAFIRENIIPAVTAIKTKERSLSRDEKEALHRRDVQVKMREKMEYFAGQIRGVTNSGTEILKLLKTWPKDLPMPIPASFRSSLTDAVRIINNLNERI